MLVAEVMLQQTQVPRVVPAYEAWVARWPTAEALAAASRAEVLRAWAGLGYNRRAVALHEAARSIAAAGGVPADLAALERLPGVGPYTARAVLCFAFGQAAMPLDTNVSRVLARSVFGRSAPADVARRTMQALADDRLRRTDRPRDAALALMDLGATVCRPAPRCAECPLSASCRWRAAGFPSEPLPRHREPPFERTARYARGRIVAFLRERGVVSTAEITVFLPSWHRPRVQAYLDGLARDGLVERRGDRWLLPELREG